MEVNNDREFLCGGGGIIQCFPGQEYAYGGVVFGVYRDVLGEDREGGAGIG